ncbi:hypothetical protein [Rhodanobacter sp. T12-5]|uniref:hypothetical protein n=1 Tax=Rhodanobacter sp. T12-5 TaxID=2024611 RepID=UPI001F5BAD93|nr:hypothetical protein [Rhodanobacter sp. T12-5]
MIAYDNQVIHAKPPLLTHLRRHRGLWVLAVAVLLIKLVMGSICLGDDPAAARLADTQTATSALATMDSATTAAPDDNACLLGEAGGCHCTCAHALTLTTSITLSVALLDVTRESSRLSLGLVPVKTGSLLRPPIA